MTTSKIYKYIGYNGVITSKVLIDTPNKIEMIELRASKGKILTDGQRKLYRVITIKEEISSWKEIDDEVLKDSEI